MLGVPLDHDPPHARDRDHGQDVDQVDRRQHGQDDEPEPQEHEDLLVDDVQGEDAHGIVDLDGAGASVLVEGALGDPGENLDHGIVPVLGVGLGPVEHVGAVGHEDAAEEGVEEVHLANDVDEVEDVADEVFEGVEVVQVERLADVLDQDGALVLPLVQAQSATYKQNNDH